MEQAAQLWIMIAAIACGLLGARLARITPWKQATLVLSWPRLIPAPLPLRAGADTRSLR